MENEVNIIELIMVKVYWRRHVQHHSCILLNEGVGFPGVRQERTAVVDKGLAEGSGVGGARK